MTNKFFIFSLLTFFALIFSSVGVLACSYTLPCPGGGDWCLCGYNDTIGFSGDVVATESIPDIDLKYGEVREFYLNANIYGYDWINITTNDSGNFESAYVELEDSRECFNSPKVQFCLIPSYTGANANVLLQITSLSLDGFVEVNLVGGNEYLIGNVTWASATNLEFEVTSGNFGSTSGLDSDYSFISAIANNFISIFPDKDTVSTSAKFGMMLVTFLLVSIILYMLMWKAGGGTIHGFSHWIVGGVDFVLFLFFVGIGYVSIAVLIVLGLIVLLLAYLRTKAA